MSNLYNANNDGRDGDYYMSIAGDMYVMVGSDENTYPSTKVDGRGMDVGKTLMTGSSGAVRFGSAVTKCEELTTAHLFRTGRYFIHAGNEIQLTSGAGGITLDTSGNIRLNAGGGMVSINTPMTVDFASKTMQITATEGVRMSSDVVEMDVKDTNFSGNTAFNKNMILKGSLGVNGELYTTHMTSQSQMMMTDPANGSVGGIVPISSFALCNGSSVYAQVAQELVGVPPHVGMPPTPRCGMIDVVLDMGDISTDPDWIALLEEAGPAAPALMYLANALYSKPEMPKMVKIGFPYGIHLISNQFATNMPETCVGIDSAESVEPLSFIEETAGIADTYGVEHEHHYYIPACTLLESTDEVWEAATACNEEEAAPAAQMQPFGMDASAFAKKMAKMWAKRQIDALTPQWLKDWFS